MLALICAPNVDGIIIVFNAIIVASTVFNVAKGIYIEKEGLHLHSTTAYNKILKMVVGYTMFSHPYSTERGGQHHYIDSIQVCVR